MSANKKQNLQIVQSVPTNVITGFLGVGKTSAILHLLKSKPTNERWAVLVNEFGEIGVDGSLIQGQQKDAENKLASGEKTVFIREVLGGCMCCASGLPMQIALTQLLSESRPDRLLIEPTGLGHPKEVLDVLTSEHYKQFLSLQKTLTLVDARKLADPRYTSHDTFNQQIGVADTIIGNKLDLYQEGDQEELISYVKQNGKPDADIIFTQQGELELTALMGLSEEVQKTNLKENTQHKNENQHSLIKTNKPQQSAAEVEIPECGYLKAVNTGEGFYSIGWRFANNKVFEYQKLYSLLTGLECERMKSVFITNKGVFGYNLTPDSLTELNMEESSQGIQESVIEVISNTNNDNLEPQILACLIN